MSDEKRDQLPSYGVVGISRCQVGGRGATLFNSPFRHHHVIALTISSAYTRRDLNETRVFSEKEMVRVSMSEVQFAQMVTTLNCGDGTPCTIERFDGQSIPAPPIENFREIHAKEARESLEGLSKAALELDALTKKSSWNAAEKARMRDLSGTIERTLRSNLGFAQEQFERKMTEVVAAAKAEVEAHVSAVLRNAGLEHLASQTPRIEG